MFPLSNWTELDVWQYIREEQHRAALDLLRPRARGVPRATGCSTRVSDFVELLPGEEPFEESVRFRTVGDMSCTGAVASTRRDARRRWWPRSPPRGSPSAARRAPTTASPRRRWRTARRRATSRMARRAPPTGRPVAARTSELVRFATAGSVDDGKSTLIGRLLYDTKSIFEDQLEHVERDLEAARRRLREPGAADRRPARRARAGHHDRRRLPLLPHAAAQVHHRRHARPRAVHAQHGHGRVDRRPRARARRRAQGRARAVAPARLHRLAAAHPAPGRVRQQDGPGRLRPGGLRPHRAEFAGWAAKLDIHDVTFIPISALHGDNVVERSERMPWYEGPSLLYHLEHVHVASDRNLQDARFPVQWVVRPMSDEHHDYRGYAGEVASRRLPRRRRGRRAAVGAHVADRVDRHLRGRARRGVPAAVGDAAPRGRHRRLARRHDLPPAEPPGRGARDRRDGLLDVRARRCPRRRATASSTPRAPRSRRSTRCATAST